MWMVSYYSDEAKRIRYYMYIRTDEGITRRDFSRENKRNRKMEKKERRKKKRILYIEGNERGVALIWKRVHSWDVLCLYQGIYYYRRPSDRNGRQEWKNSRHDSRSEATPSSLPRRRRPIRHFRRRTEKGGTVSRRIEEKKTERAVRRPFMRPLELSESYCRVDAL